MIKIMQSPKKSFLVQVFKSQSFYYYFNHINYFFYFVLFTFLDYFIKIY